MGFLYSILNDSIQKLFSDIGLAFYPCFLIKPFSKNYLFVNAVQEKAEYDIKKLRQSAVFGGKPRDDLHQGLRSPENSTMKVRLISNIHE
jgi:hypothetical protein